jgi:radical SAM superfamily enzyme YgiQ (UPF0313 family)
VRALLISTYDLGRQPYGLASPAAWLRRDGVEVECVDMSRDPLDDGAIASAALIGLYLPMHTATRLAAPLLDRIRRVNPAARLAAYGLYAPLNTVWLHDRGVRHVLGAEAEADLVRLAAGDAPRDRGNLPSGVPERLRMIQPDRSTLPALARYAALQMPDGRRKVVGATDATRGCKHLCRHCPIVPVYKGVFRAVPIDVVLDDVRAQVGAGAEHISFGDPDFLNGPTHARRLVERFARECPDVTYDVTIKVEHLLQHRDMLGLLRDTGCLFITSAVESVDDAVLERLRKGHTRADVEEAVGLCRRAGVALAPTFVPFTPWTTLAGYVDLLDEIARLDLVEAVAPVQLAIRLLVTAESKLLELADIRGGVEPYDQASLTYPWQHPDARVDELQRDVMALVGSQGGAPRAQLFDQVVTLAQAARGSDPLHGATHHLESRREGGQTPPVMTEAWYCCAEPGPELLDLV